MTVRALLSGHAPAATAQVTERALDVMAALTAARGTREGAMLDELFREAPLAGAAALARYSECDPIHVPSCATTDAVAVPVALAAARDARSFRLAVWSGGIVGVRLASAVGGVAALSRGIWPGLLVAPAVAAVAQCVAEGRSEDETASALALALAGTSGRAGRPGGVPSGRWTVFGQAVAGGLAAARAVASGACGDTGILSPEWLTDQSAGASDPSCLAGTERETEVDLKPAVAARQGLSALAAFRQLLDAGLAPHRIVSITVALPAACLPVVTRPVVPGLRLSEIANLPLTLATAALAPERLLDIGRDTPPSADIAVLAGRIVVVADPALEGRVTWPAQVTVETATGRHEASADTMPGATGAEGRRDMLRAKLVQLGTPELTEILDDPDRILSQAGLPRHRRDRATA